MEIFFCGLLDKDRTLNHFVHMNFPPSNMITNIFDSFKQRMILDSIFYKKRFFNKFSNRKQKNLRMA